MPTPRRAFTLIELLVVVAIIAILVGIILPTLAQVRLSAKAVACGSRLGQIGVGLTLYLGDHDNTLPQLLGPLPEGGESVIGALFGGKRGQLPFYGINEFGASRRPLNPYVTDRALPIDADGEEQQLPEFLSPADRGAETTGIPIEGLDRTDSMHEFIGSSYTLNDHSLTAETDATLVPLGGGPMPPVRDTTRTIAIASHPIYNFQQDGDTGMRWYARSRVEASILYLDFHVRTRVRVPSGIVNTTPDYTFLP